MADNPGPSGPHGQQQSRLYTLVMTPVNFVAFLFSLLLVEIHYTIKRSRNHGQQSSRLPAWLNHLLYSPQPYSVAQGRGNLTRPGTWFYHSKQKKLMKMEAEQAFAMRNTVLVLLAVLMAATTAAGCFVLRWLYHQIPLLTG